MKVVIANSIGVDSAGYHIIHSPSRWSEGVRDRASWFAYYPWELAYCSSLIKKHTGCQVKFLDGCLERLDSEEYFRRIARESPDWLVMESGSRMIRENTELAKRVKKESGARIIFTGQHASAFPEHMLQNGIDFVCIGEYEYTVLELLQGRDKEDIPGLYPNKRRPLLDINNLPWPEDEDVRRMDYGRPGEPSSEYLEIQAYASRGCPRSCTFCVARNVYYAQPNWRQRDIKDVIDELKHLKNRYPEMEGVFFDEEAHNVSKDFTLRLASAIIDSKLDSLHYEAMCDITALDKETTAAMHNAGYYKIRLGIESAEQAVLDRSKKGLDAGTVTEKLEIIKDAGLKTYGTFMIGMPGSSEKADLKTVSYIEKMISDGLLDNVQISICTPQPGTPFYDYVKDRGYIITEDYRQYDGGRGSVVSYPEYKNKAIESIMNFAFRTREHASFLRSIRRKDMLKWALRTYKKWGLLLTLSKLIRRCRLEIVHILSNRISWIRR